MPDDRIVREKAREAIQTGSLPKTRPSRMFAGPSTGATCAVCGTSVAPGELEYELEFRVSPVPEGKSLRDALERLEAGPEPRVNHFHHNCFRAWELERTNVCPIPRGPSP